METLADYVRRVRHEKNISTQKVEELSRGGITDGYVSQIENDRVKNVSPEKLKALAKGLGVPEEEIFNVARGAKPTGSRLIDQIVNYLQEISVDRQKDILSFAKLFYEESQEANKTDVVLPVSKTEEKEISAPYAR